MRIRALMHRWSYFRSRRSAFQTRNPLFSGEAFRIRRFARCNRASGIATRIISRSQSRRRRYVCQDLLRARLFNRIFGVNTCGIGECQNDARELSTAIKLASFFYRSAAVRLLYSIMQRSTWRLRNVLLRSAAWLLLINSFKFKHAIQPRFSNNLRGSEMHVIGKLGILLCPSLRERNYTRPKCNSKFESLKEDSESRPSVFASEDRKDLCAEQRF